MKQPCLAGLTSLAVALAVPAGCASTPKQADYVGNPKDMRDACTRAATVCPRDDEWMACKDDQWECHRLGLWYDDGIKVEKSPEQARKIYEAMCDRFEMGSCESLCKTGDTKRCVDLALLGIAGAGGRPFPPSYRADDRETFAKACSGGDTVACAMLALRYQPGSQRVVQRVNRCFDDSARCFALACDEDDPLACALLCHDGDTHGCGRLALLARAGIGFDRPLTALASRLPEGDSSQEGTYEFERHEQRAGVIPRAPKPPERPVGEGLWSGWKTVHNVEGGSFGVAPIVTRVVGSRHDTTAVSGLVGFASEIYMRSWYPGDDKYLRFALAGAIGGGTAGLDGRISHDAMAGFRFPFATETSNPFRGGTLYQSMSDQDKDSLDRAIFTHSPHALFVRGGYALRYSAVGPVLSSAVEIPRVEAGWQYEGDEGALRALELRLNGSLVAVGRFDVGDDERPLGGGVAWGGAVVLHARRIHTELGAERIQGALFGARPPTERVDARACLRVVARDERHYRYLVCLDELLEHAELVGAETTAWQAGLFFGLDGLD